MFKKTIHFENYDGELASEVVEFNLTKAELLDFQTELDQDLKEKFKFLLVVEEAGEEPVPMTNEDKKAILALFKDLIKRAYGVRSEDGKRFIKSEDLFRQFTQTPAYDAFIWELLTKPNEGNEFIAKVLPPDLLKQAQDHLEKQPETVKLPEAQPVEGLSKPSPLPYPNETLNSWVDGDDIHFEFKGKQIVLPRDMETNALDLFVKTWTNSLK